VFHEIDGEYFNFVNEIPKNTKAKMEVSTKEQFNPIAQGRHVTLCLTLS